MELDLAAGDAQRTIAIAKIIIGLMAVGAGIVMIWLLAVIFRTVGGTGR